MTFCNKWWWTNILYISNLYPCQTWDLSSTNPDNNWGDKDYATCSNGQGELGCMIQTWYLSNDFQMFLAVVPCALLFKWKVWAAYAYNAALTGGCLWWGYANMSSHFMTMCDMMICGHSYGRRLMGADLSDPDAIDSLSDDVHRRLQGYGYGGPSFCDNPAKADVQVYYYDKPWARYPPYGVGVMLAIMLMHIRREPGVPASAVKFLSNGCPDVDNKIAKPPKFHPIVACLGWAAALGVLFYCSFGPYYAIPKTDTPHDCPWGGSYEQAPEDADGYSIGHGKRTHSFWDLTFSTCFRMWCVLYIYIPSLRVRSSLSLMTASQLSQAVAPQLAHMRLSMCVRARVVPAGGRWAWRGLCGRPWLSKVDRSVPSSALPSGNQSRTSPLVSTCATSWSSTSCTTRWASPSITRTTLAPISSPQSAQSLAMHMRPLRPLRPRLQQPLLDRPSTCL